MRPHRPPVDDFGGEFTLLRRAVERLAVERAGQGHAPDCFQTLGVIAANITATAQRVDRPAKSPALSLTPGEISRQIIVLLAACVRSRGIYSPTS